MIPQPCRANDILRDQFARLQTSRTPSMDRDKLISYAEAYRMLLEIDAADFAYWERIALMTMKENDHPAFPSDTGTWGPIMGMTLRDYFAAKAMQAIISSPSTIAEMCKAAAIEPLEAVPIAAYSMADAMLEMREKME